MFCFSLKWKHLLLCFLRTREHLQKKENKERGLFKVRSKRDSLVLKLVKVWKMYSQRILV